MSWSLTLTASRPIEESDLRFVLSDEDISRFPKRQAWGWPGSITGLGVDVDLPEGKYLTLRGADYSAHLAKAAAERVAAGLRKLRYNVWVGELEQ